MTVEDPATILTKRPAAYGDVEGIVNALLASAEHHARLDPERYFVPAAGTLLTRYRDMMRLPDEGDAWIMMVAEDGGEIAGFVEARLEQSPDPMHKDVRYCHVGELAVQRRYRNQGIGAGLLGAAEDWGRRRGAAFASLDYHAANTRAAAFYQRRMGYAIAAITAIKGL